MNIVIGSRGSRLALWQASWVRDRLRARHHEVRIEIIKTTGDKLTDVPLAAPETKGLFIKELEESLLRGEVDIAVHSMKDLPTEQPDSLVVAATPEREDARDVLIARNGKSLAGLPPGARLGTGSLRRQSQLRALRRDLEIAPVRGNVDTRLKKLDRGEYDALSLAAAGLKRLGWRARITQTFSVHEVCPAVGQGALAIEARQDRSDLLEAVAALDHAPTRQAVIAERAVLRSLGGGCQLPLAAHAEVESGRLHLTGVVASLDGSRVLRASATAPMEDAENLGRRVAEDLAQQGARELLSAT